MSNIKNIVGFIKEIQRCSNKEHLLIKIQDKIYTLPVNRKDIVIRTKPVLGLSYKNDPT